MQMITTPNRFSLIGITHVLILASLIVASLLIALPTINRHVQDPRLIAYFNHDEGYIMDLIWYYYSGEKSVSFQYDRDYGLEFRYLSDIGRLVLSRFFTLTPGTFILILRWFNVTTWIFSIIVLWLLMRRHFNGSWSRTAAILLIGTSPAFALLCGNSKPEPLVLLLMLAGLHYTLKIIESPRLFFVFIAVVFAASAFLVKYAGIFLLPAIVAAMTFAAKDDINIKPAFPAFRFSWALPAVCGFLFISLPFAIIFLYRRRTTALTWYEQCGFWQSLGNNKGLVYFMAAGMLLIIISLGLWLLNRSRGGRTRQFADIVNKLNSNGIIVMGLFVLCCLTLGFKWVTQPSVFIDYCAQTGREAFGYAPQAMPSAGSFFEGFANRIKNIDAAIFALFLVYLIVEFRHRRESLTSEKHSYFKRLTLAVFILPILPYAATGARLAQHHLLPFFAAIIILCLEGVGMLLELVRGNSLMKSAVIALSGVLIIYMIAHNARNTIEAFANMYHQHDDVIFDLVKWWRENSATDARILADHPTRVYLPPEYINARFIKSIDEADRIEEIRRVVRAFRPDFIYYNASPDKRFVTPPITEVVPEINAKLVASFSSGGRFYKRYPSGKYLIYKVFH